MKVWRILTLTMVLVIAGAPLVAGFMNWLPPAVRAGVLSLAPPMAAALVFVLYLTGERGSRAASSATLDATRNVRQRPKRHDVFARSRAAASRS